jgi:broad specificity phosphatase PhoE
VYLRCAAFLRYLVERPQDGDVIVVAHGGSIRMLRAFLANDSLSGLPWGTVPNASICRVVLPVPTLVNPAS